MKKNGTTRALAFAVAAALVVGGVAVTFAVAENNFARFDEEKFEERREAMQTVYFAKLQEELKLPQERANQLFAMIEKQHQTIQPLKKELRQSMKTLREAIQAGTLDEATASQLNGRIVTLRNDIHAQKEAFSDDVASFLSPVEFSKFMVISVGAKHKMMRGMREHHRFNKRMVAPAE